MNSFINKYLLDVYEIIEEIDKMYAHTSTDRTKEPELLKEHLDLVMEQFVLLDKKQSIIKKIKLLLTDILIEAGVSSDIDICVEFFVKAFINAIYLHDIGKASIGCQVNVFDNSHFKSYYQKGMVEEHSPYSTRIYLDIMIFELIQLISDNKIEYSGDNDYGFSFLGMYILAGFSYCIQKHHSGLDNFNDFLCNLKYTCCRITDNDEEFISSKEIPDLIMYKNSTDCFEHILSIKSVIEGDGNSNVLNPIKEKLFVLNRILFSILVTADSLATAQYMNDFKVDFKDINVKEAIETYRNTELYKSIQHYFETGESNSEINAVRCEIVKEVESNINQHIDKNIFYLESPTGSGKTNLSCDLSIKILELTSDSNVAMRRIIYSAPFNSITTQTAEFWESIFKDTDIDTTLINSSVPIKIKTGNNNEPLYELTLLDYQMLNYSVTLTSHVKIFDALFGTSRLNSHMLSSMFNSIIIIDEIQAYNPMVWAKMIRLMDVYAKYMNIKFIIMSATLPRLGDLIDSDKMVSTYVDLIKDTSTYFENECFKKRVSKYNYDMLDDSYTNMRKTLTKDAYKRFCFETILNKIREIYKERNAKILVEFLTIKSCREFYDYVISENIKNKIKDETLIIEELTSRDSPYIRKELISKVKSNDNANIILISTQCIEAGVDIDMDYGWKNVSYIDSEEQFAGRICRNYKKGRHGEVHFFLLDDANDIYGVNGVNYKQKFSVLNLKYRHWFEEKKFKLLFDEMLKNINKSIHSQAAEVTIQSFNLMLKKLNYKAIEKSLQLIETQQEFTIMLPFTIHVTDNNDNDIVINGAEVWNEFKRNKYSNGYAKTVINKKNIRCNLSYFCFRYKFKHGENEFEAFLMDKGITYEYLNGIYYLDIPNKYVEQLIDSRYKLKESEFKEFSILR